MMAFAGVAQIDDDEILVGDAAHFLQPQSLLIKLHAAVQIQHIDIVVGKSKHGFRSSHTYLGPKFLIKF